MVNLNFNEVSDVVRIKRELIPHGTVARAVMKIIYNPIPIPNEDPAVHKAPATGSVYTKFEWTIIDGAYAGRRIWDTKWWTAKTEARTMGMILRIIEDNYALNSKDESPEVQAVRKLKALSDIDGFEACIVIAKNEGSLKDNGEKYPDENAVLTVLNNSGRDYIPRKSPPKAIPSTPQPMVEGSDLMNSPSTTWEVKATPADQIQDDPIPF
mgnify:FL=1